MTDMRKTHQHRLLRGAMAAVLACGLMMPTTALTAFADEEKSATPPLDSKTEVGSDSTFDAAVSDAGAGEPAAGGSDVTDGGTPEGAAHAASLGTQYLGRAVGSDGAEAAPASAVPASEGEPAAQSNTVTLGGFTMVGEGIQASDFTLASNLLTINTDKPFTISGSSTTVGLVVPAGVKAHMTLDGITVSAGCAFDIKAGGEAHLILADGKTNSFTSTNVNYPGIHCGTGAVLSIDDAVPNIDVDGKPITPAQGQIPAGTKYIDNTGAERVSTGDYLTLLDSPNRGTLVVHGGGDGAALGGAYREDGGSMTFNGGRIQVTNGVGPNSGSGGGAGIGGGKNAAGTSPTEWITVNGGWITSNASYHGAGFGGGWNSGTTPVVAGLVQSAHPGGTGNIRINGGYIESNGGKDGNGFGRGCYGDRKYCDNRDYTILITGGTMIPSGGTNLGDPWGNDIGGAGTQTSSSGHTDSTMAATVIVSGGSVYVGKRADGNYRFDGIAYGSFTEADDGTIAPIKDEQVVPITINLTADLKALDPTNPNPDLDRTITSWNLLVGGEEVGYGAPAQFNNGNLYLWLTPKQADQQVTVQLSYEGPDGKPVPVEPLYRPAGSTGGETNLKRYVFFDLQDDFFEQKDGGTGEATVAYDVLSSYEQKKYKDDVDENGLVKVPVVKKSYDGLPYQVKELSADNSINSGGDDNKPIWDQISYLCQLYDAKEGKLGAEVQSDDMPTDTGLTRFTMTSTQYSSDKEYVESYYGHRAYGWCEIIPVPAVLKISEDNGAAWVRLANDGSSYEVVKETDAEPGNRLRLAFDIRSAKGTATTCKAPTGSFQVMIDGKPVGEPIVLPADAFKAGAGKVSFKDAEGASVLGSTIEVVPGDEGRETTRVVYYLDPSNLDGALDALASDAASNTHEVTVRYVPDKNYVEGTEDNPQNEATQPTPIIPVKPEGGVTPEDPDKVEIEDSPDPAPGPGGTDPDNPTGKMQVVRKTITVSYGDFHQKDAELDDFFKMALTSNSSAPGSFSVSNTAVVDLLRDSDGNPVIDEGGKLQVVVNSCGTSIITLEQKANALFTGIKYILTVNVTPDPSIRPKIQIRLTWRNLTALGEAAGEPACALVSRALGAVASGNAASFAATRAAANRADTPPRPGDVLEYTVTGLNLTLGSAWQAAELKDAIDQKLSFDSQSVEIAPNYATHSDRYNLGTAAFYQDFDWDGLGWSEVSPTATGTDGFTYVAPTLTKGIGTVYGGQSTSVRFRATVGEDQGLGDRPGEDGKLPELTNEPEGAGSFGKPEGDLKPGETPTDPKPLDPAADIEIVGDGDPDPETGAFPKPEPTPVLPKDPAAGHIVTTVKVEPKEKGEDHDDDRFLVGDVLQVTVTSTNTEPDSKLANAVIKATLPEGMEPKPGTIVLTDAEGNTYPVPDSAYDPKTGTIAVNAGDLYGGESAKLTFDVEVLSTPDTRDPDNPADPDNPGGTPGDPDKPGTEGGRPTEPVIEGGTLGETPTDEWDREHPMVPDPDNPDGPLVPGEPAEPGEKPKPGTPFVPTKPWPELEDELVSTPPTTDKDMPPVLPASPSIEGTDGAEADIKLAKTAENLTRGDGTTAVGDAIRYTVTLSNSKPHSMWYGAVIRDVLPQGLEPLAGTIRLTAPDGSTVDVPDAAYDPATRTLAVTVGDLAGGRTAVLTFECEVTEEAVGADIGNVASAHGKTPAGVDVDSVSPGAERPTPGEPFVPSEGWDAFLKDSPGVDNADAPAYAPGTDSKGGIKPADEQDDGGDGAGAGKGDSKTRIKLAQTGDQLLGAAVALALAAAAALAVLVVVAVRRRRERRDRHTGQW
ncbi:hypothetical protein [uncultured Adlercreutzia sp.]|uniref:hypothetical protein n=1 Tax=uncultured Adlercreutzia sp. TaxID=875803 RepID=UPI0025A581FA|nr:hypothetical protein [uncultured Adlercreutzia sp.]